MLDQQTPSERTAEAVGRVLHPGVMLLVAAVATAISAPASVPALTATLAALGVVIVLGVFVFPALGKSLGWPEDRRKTLSFAACAGVLAVGLVVSALLGAPALLIANGIAFVVGATLIALGRWRWNISVHTAIFTGIVLGLGTSLSPLWFAALVALPILIWSRAASKRQSIAQSLWGSAIGVVAWLAYLLSLSLLGA
ncbi:hypothetical protein [Paenarthrobacter nitroguajacolicus]|uniref:hypothetical protein n=1 Tax=Paenarthrobacter nitroguajacolicus TaxID=211146 RepID=UPI00248B03B1|nr:hypothetical protein [Paenarthrobacter nitroguajacolicus]